MSDPVTLVRWRRADTDPPDGDHLVLTDASITSYYDDGAWWYNDLTGDDERIPLLPEPVWWCDYPAPPAEDAS